MGGEHGFTLGGEHGATLGGATPSIPFWVEVLFEIVYQTPDILLTNADKIVHSTGRVLVQESKSLLDAILLATTL